MDYIKPTNSFQGSRFQFLLIFNYMLILFNSLLYNNAFFEAIQSFNQVLRFAFCFCFFYDHYHYFYDHHQYFCYYYDYHHYYNYHNYYHYFYYHYRCLQYFFNYTQVSLEFFRHKTNLFLCFSFYLFMYSIQIYIKISQKQVNSLP